MVELNDYIIATRKNLVSNDNEGRMVEKCIIEIQGTILVKIRDNAFNGNIRENAFKHIDKFLEVGPIKINRLTQDRFRLRVFHVSLARATSEWFTKEYIGSITTWDNMFEKFIMKFHHLSDHDEEEETEKDDNPNETDNVPEIFKIEGYLFDFETPLCEAFNEFNYLLKIDTDMFTYDIQNFKKYKRELNNDIARGPEEPWSKNGVPYQLYHKWYDELADGKLKSRTLALKAKVEGSFENFHELDYDVLVKLQECWWKVNAHEITPFTRIENFRRGPYANMKTKKTRDPYLDVNRIFGRNYEESNVGDTQENQGHEEHKDNPTSEPSNWVLVSLFVVCVVEERGVLFVFVNKSEKTDICLVWCWSHIDMEAA
ncbi:hypothetical protein Tco_1408176 [Tanacetum coccineum]